MVAEGSRVVQPADGRDDVAVFLQGLQRPGEPVVLAGREDLVVERVDAVGEVDEGAAPGRGGGAFRRTQRDHAVQQGQGYETAQRAESVAAVHQPGLGQVVAHRGFLSWDDHRLRIKSDKATARTMSLS